MKIRSLIFSLLIAPFLLVAQENQTAKFSGLVFGDYYYVAKNHNSSYEGKNGLWVRRVYFTFDKKLTEQFSMRFRLEMNNRGLTASSASSMVPFVKDLYIKYKKGHHQVLLGISPAPTFNKLESVWGYRSVEKTPVDLFKLGSSRETGLAIKGTFGPAQKAYYHAMFGNGNAQKNETNRGKKVMLALGWNFTKALTIEAYGDYDDRGNQKRYTYQAFVGYRSNPLRAGLLVTRQFNRMNGNNTGNITLFSAFTVVRLKDNLHFLARIDRLSDPVAKGESITYLPMSQESSPTFMVIGLDYFAQNALHLIPNLEVVHYQNSAIQTDILPRLTFYYAFK